MTHEDVYSQQWTPEQVWTFHVLNVSYCSCQHEAAKTEESAISLGSAGFQTYLSGNSTAILAGYMHEVHIPFHFSNKQ